MRRVQADDPDAFAALYDRFAARAYGVAYAVARDPARAEDAVQEAFLSMWRSRSDFDPARGPVAGWVARVVRNRALDGLRRHARHDSRRADGEGLAEQLAAPGDVEATAVERDDAAQLHGLLARLPAAQREVIALSYFGELSTSEIATRLSLPHGTVKGRMRLALTRLREDTLSG